MRSPKYSGKPKKPKLILVRRVVGISMMPTLMPRRLVLGTGWFRTLRNDQLVIIRHDGLEKIKRIQSISDNQVYVVGDNPSGSLDSRSFGWIPASSVMAIIIWPRT